MKNPILQCQAGRLFSEWELDPFSSEGQKMIRFRNSDSYQVLRKILTYRASELTESLIFPKEPDDTIFIRGALQEVLGLISELDDLVLDSKPDEVASTQTDSLEYTEE